MTAIIEYAKRRLLLTCARKGHPFALDLARQCPRCMGMILGAKRIDRGCRHDGGPRHTPSCSTEVAYLSWTKLSLVFSTSGREKSKWFLS